MAAFSGDRSTPFRFFLSVSFKLFSRTTSPSFSSLCTVPPPLGPSHLRFVWALGSLYRDSFSLLIGALGLHFFTFIRSSTGIFNPRHFDASLILLQEHYLRFFRARLEFGGASLVLQSLFFAMSIARLTDDGRALPCLLQLALFAARAVTLSERLRAPAWHAMTVFIRAVFAVIGLRSSPFIFAALSDSVLSDFWRIISAVAVSGGRSSLPHLPSSDPRELRLHRDAVAASHAVPTALFGLAGAVLWHQHSFYASWLCDSARVSRPPAFVCAEVFPSLHSTFSLIPLSPAGVLRLHVHSLRSHPFAVFSVL
jgi:hypothetical protein